MDMSIQPRPDDRSPAEDRIAITGYSYRLPGGLKTDDDFWRLLCSREIVQEPVSQRYGRGVRPIENQPEADRFGSPYEGLITGDDELKFDGGLFGISQREVSLLNPQTRLMLNCAWELIEHAGWNMRDLRNSTTGVFVGAQTPAAANWRPLVGVSEFSVLNASLAIIANRISYHFNLMGSSMTYCTACSAGLSALHSALNAIHCGDCDAAIVGAVTYLGSAKQSVGFSALGVISPDGKCNSFDAGANGYMRSEGCLAFALKKLSVAERDGDRIYAVIESTAVNSAGAADDAEGLAPGRYITAPTQHSQIELLKTARLRANRSAEDFDYIEAHGTGTTVGDRIEGNAIAEAFGGCRRETPLRLSSVKSNIGHLEAAAFHASLLKIILMFQRRTFIPISKNYLDPNPEIDFGSCPMHVQTHCEPFPDRPVLVGINSFGFGGASGHCVISEYRPSGNYPWSVPLAPDSGYMIPLSARNPNALIENAQNLREHLESERIDLYTLAGNLATRRTHFPACTSFSVFDQDDLIRQLRDFEDSRELAAPPPASETAERRLMMVFAGQGTQWAGCGQKLYRSHPVFRRVVDAIEGHWLEHADFSLRDACLAATQDELNEVRLAQPAIFLIQCALVELLKTWNVYPDVVVGHSSGEIAAAYASGALSLADATRVIFHRSQAQQRVAGSGRMLAINIDRASIERLLAELGISSEPDDEGAAQAEFACINSPVSSVVCGQEDVMRRIAGACDERQVLNVMLPGNIAFHSSAMERIRSEMLSAISFLDGRKFETAIPFISSVTGAVTQCFDSSYWWSNTRQPVMFASAMETIMQDYPVEVVLEISPHPALSMMVAQCFENASAPTAIVSTLMREQDERRKFNEMLGELYRHGVELDFAAQFPRPEPITDQLPGHAKNLQVLVDDGIDDEMFVDNGDHAFGPLLGRKMPANHLLYESRLCEANMPYLSDHKVRHTPIMPAAGYIEIILQALAGQPAFFEEIEFLQPCPINKKPSRMQTALYLDDNSTDEYTFEIYTTQYVSDAESIPHCRGRVRLLSETESAEGARFLSDLDTGDFEPFFDSSQGSFYDILEAMAGDNYQYGENFRTMQELKADIDANRLLFDVKVDAELWQSSGDEGYVLFPPLIDGGLQSLLAYTLASTEIHGIPQRARDITFLGRPTTPHITVHVDASTAMLNVRDELGRPKRKHVECTVGALQFFDSKTGELFLAIANYADHATLPNWADMPDYKHTVNWHPKFNSPHAAQGGALNPRLFINSLAQLDSGDPRVLHVVEFAGAREPGQTMLGEFVESFSIEKLQIEYWLANDAKERTEACFEAFQHHRLPTRFITFDPNDASSFDFSSGLLRLGAANVILLHQDSNGFSSDDWLFMRRLAVAGGYALVRHDENSPLVMPPDCAWTIVCAEKELTLLQAPQSLHDERSGCAERDTRLIIGNDDFTDSWKTLLGQRENVVTHSASIDDAVSLLTHEWNAIDYFVDCGLDDPTGERACVRLIEFVQALLADASGVPSTQRRISVITENSVMHVKNPQQYSTWGAIRSAVVEFGAESAFDFRLIDIGAENDLKTLDWLSRNDLREREIAIRDGQLWAPRIVHIKDLFPLVDEIDDTPYRLILDRPGQISGLNFQTFLLPELGENDIEMEVQSAGLNFRDIMFALGKLPLQAYERSFLGHEIGMEASGVVRRTGRKVAHHRPGDRVIAIKGGCIANREVVDQHMVFPKPDVLNMDEAASVLSVYVTAYYSLIKLAGIKKGQRVLIHSAMGGVGQAAMELSRHIGAEVFATAGSDGKREQLRKLGVVAAFDSHSFEWHDELMQATGGEGVDVVLNSLAGRHLHLCLQALKPGGWHLEIGKVDIYADSSLSMKAFQKNLRFAAVDIDRLMCDDPALSREISEDCLDLLGKGAVRPVPVTAYELKDYAQALRSMTSGKHQGKLVLKMPSSADRADELRIVDRRSFLDASGTYLITGGFGGLGLLLLPYLAVNGVRHFTMMDRSQERGRTAEWVRKWSGSPTLLDSNVQIEIVPGDVSSFDEVERCIAQLDRPLKGIFHLAGTLDDQFLSGVSPDSVAEVFSSKATGALNLHQASMNHELDHFVMFSSVASVFGNIGQVNYSAANAFLDALAGQRQQLGLPSLSINLTGVAETGMAVRNPHASRMIKASGMPLISASHAIRCLDYALRKMHDQDHVIAAIFEQPPFTADSGEYMRSGRCVKNQSGFRPDSSSEHTLESVVTKIADKVAELSGHDGGDVDEPLSSYGLTSISAAELGAFIFEQYGHQVSALVLMTTASCRSIAESILKTDVEEDSEEVESTIETVRVSRPLPHREPSKFAFTHEDHFAPPTVGDADTASTIAERRFS